jgi:predicted AlkP superfamily phosphohydrolase/phosphomutase/tetratricopeptide (TPR) repeat protein
MSSRPAKRLLIVGWDAADWKIIDDLFGHGRMPVLRQVVEQGVRGDLSTLYPALSPLLWTSIATGKTADKHGVLHFIEPDPSTGELRQASSTTRRTKALWNIFTQAGLRTNVISWYASHPAEPIRGCCISNLFQENPPPNPADEWPLPSGSVQPEAIARIIAQLRLHPAEIHPQELLSLVPALSQMDMQDRRLGELARQIARCATIHNTATSLLSKSEAPPWDCTMVFYDTIDVVGHHFMQYHPPRMTHVREEDFEHYRHVMYGVYQLQDMMLGTLLELAGPDTTVLVLSDHGFHSDHLRPQVQASLDDQHAAMDASWHRPLGIIAVSGPGVRKGDRIYGANLLDIAPTALTLLGVPIGADMDGRVLVEALETAPTLERVFSWDTLEGESGQHPPDMQVDPYEATSTMKHLAELGYIQPLGTDASERLAYLDRETRFNLAVVYMTTRRVREAIPILRELVAEQPAELRYAMNLIQCLMDAGDSPGAREVLAEVLHQHPDHADAQLFLGITYLGEGRHEEAVAALEQAEHRRGSASRPDVDNMLGSALLQLRRLDDAERVFARAAATDPHDPRAQHGLARVALGRESFEQAAEFCLRAVGLHHFYPDAHYTLGVALTWMQDFEHAIKAFNVALSMQPGLIDAHRYLASIYRHLGDRTNAPKHRDLALHFLQERARGGNAPTMHEAPMGPQEWMQRLGIHSESQDEPASADQPEK